MKKSEELLALNQIITLGNESSSLQEFLEKSYKQVLEIVEFDRGGVYLYNNRTQYNKLVYHTNVHPDFIKAVENVDISAGLFSRVFDKVKPYYIEDFSIFMENAKDLGVHSAIIIPLRAKERYVGSLNCAAPHHQELTQEELDFLLAMGRQMGIIIQKFESEKLLRESEEKYREAYNQTDFYKDLLAHDIGNILNNIRSSIELYNMWEGNETKVEDRKEMIEIIERQVDRGASLISNVHRLTEVEQADLAIKEVEVKALLEEIIKPLSGKFRNKEVNLNIEATQEFYNIRGGDFLIDVFDNIIRNGIIHNENEKVELNIKVSKIQKDGENYLKLEFIDNGRGIPEPRKKSIFERDYQRDRSTGGLGIGLSLVKKIVRLYDGQIWVEDRVPSDYTKGSNFIVLLKEHV